ncbi:MAG: translation initiation factor IF-2 [Desulfobacteraceae bacterium]|jgi:translation initiation factor IF-2|nr:translation initiation factor IF-2 [Desulfobacteraceae bacterium]
MAKLRVYELARELNLENKALLEKMEEMGIEVKSHMSSLDEAAIKQIKQTLFGKKTPDKVVEDKRIKPNVIRRRRKRVEPPVEPEAAEIPEVSAKEEEIKEAKEPATSEEETEDKTVETPEETAEPAAPEVEETVEADETVPAAADPEESEQDIPTEKLTEVEAEVEAEVKVEEKPKKQKKLKTPEKEKPDAEAEKAKEAPAAKPALKRKVKKGTPAKIISMPTKPVEPPKRAEAPAKAKDTQKPTKKFVKGIRKKPVTVQPPQAEPPTTDAAAKKRIRKKRTEVEVPVDIKKVKKVKGTSKRKAVVEGSALYDKSFGRSRKGRKKFKSTPAGGGQKTQITTPKAIKRRFKVDDTIVLADLGKRMGIKANELISKLMGMGMMVTVNQTIDYDTACLVATEFGFELERATFEEETVIKTEVDAPDQLLHRPPVVTIMGHVDHGKTSLLDVIRRSKITDFEAGGITQHIGAYHVKHETGEIVFLDTPGHEAFTAMRARGAKVTDIVVLVVAADDGVMPQTVEAIDHARAAGVPIIVAINKIDKPGAEPDRIKRELAEKGLAAEDWGGETILVNVSAKEKIGIDELLEMILLQSEVLELKANPNKLAAGHIVESRLDTGRGAVATVLVSEGTLRVGDPVVCGMYYGKIRIMYDDMGTQIKEAGPSIPVEIVGLSGVPMAGDELNVMAAEKDAKQVSEHRLQKQRAKELARTSRMSLEKLYEKLMEGEVKDLNLIIKADVQGSIEALKDSLIKLSFDEVKIGVIHSAVGPIRESDISLAAVSNAIILGFNVRPTAKVSLIAEEENVDIRYYDIIYNAIKDIKNAMVGLMDAKFEEKVLGEAEVRETFHVPSIGTIAGSYVTSGKIKRGAQVRLIRDGIVTYDGKVATLRRFKDDVKEVAQNYECGILIENYNDIKIGDIIECYYFEEVKPTMPV